jgi:hypothetical protein
MPTPSGGLVPPGTEAIGLGNLGGLIERQLATPSRFGSAEVQQAFQHGSQNLEDAARMAEAQATTGAQQRGMFFGSPLTTSLGDISTQLQRGKGDLLSNLLMAQAQTGGQDLNQAIANAFRFGENIDLNALRQAQMGLGAVGAGFQGAPTSGQITGQIAGQPLPGQPGVGGFGALGQLFGQQQQAPSMAGPLSGFRGSTSGSLGGKTTAAAKAFAASKQKRPQ